MKKSALDYMLSAMTSHYHSMLLNGRYTLSESYSFLDFCVNFFALNGFIVYYDEVEHKYVIAK